jgi:hypothetical protein
LVIGRPGLVPACRGEPRALLACHYPHLLMPKASQTVAVGRESAPTPKGGNSSSIRPRRRSQIRCWYILRPPSGSISDSCIGDRWVRSRDPRLPSVTDFAVSSLVFLFIVGMDVGKGKMLARRGSLNQQAIREGKAVSTRSLAHASGYDLTGNSRFATFLAFRRWQTFLSNT